ncbi:MAG: NAD(P)H-binding protein, partial [Plesiomonas shigelloides]
MRKCLVMGAAGYIGSYLVPHLQAQGYQVVAGARRPCRLPEGVEFRLADSLKPRTLQVALTGIDTVFYLVHAMGSGAEFHRLEQQGVKNFAAAAHKAGVRRIIYLGAIQPESCHSRHLNSRRYCGELFRASGVPTVELRAGIIIGPGSAAFEVMRDLVYNLPLMVTPKWVRSRTPPIALSNLLYYLTGLIEAEGIEGQIFNAAGPELLSYQQQLQKFAEHIGKRCPIIPVPFLSPKLSAWWLQFVTSVPQPVAKALVGGLKHDIPADDAALRALLPQTLLSFDQALAESLALEQKLGAEQQGQETPLGLRWRHPEYGFYDRTASGEALCLASTDTVWQELQLLGGEQRYFYMNELWVIREWMDHLIGGPALTRGRTNPDKFVKGDMLDSWQILGVDEGRRLDLLFNMKAPGVGRLEFLILPEESGLTRIRVT